MTQPVIGIIGGKGRMGSHFASFFQDRGLQVLVSDVGTKLTNEELAIQTDITIVSVPMDKSEEVIKKIVQKVPGSSALMDLTSIKSAPVKQMLKGNCEVLGMHPMFGESNHIPGQAVVLCKTKKAGQWSKWSGRVFA